MALKLDVAVKVRESLRDRKWRSLPEIMQAVQIPPERSSRRYIDSGDEFRTGNDKEAARLLRASEPPENQVAKGKRIIVCAAISFLKANGEVIERMEYDPVMARDEKLYKFVRCYCYSCGKGVSSSDGLLKPMLCIECDGLVSEEA